MIACQQAEFHRDRKKKKKPYEMDEFYCFKLDEVTDSIDAQYGSAANVLIELQMFPRWGLFIYKELMKNAKKVTAPDILCYFSDNAIILAPTILGEVCKGMLIATEQASFRVIEFDIIKSDGTTSEKIRVRLPQINGKTAAIENCCMDILG